MSLLSTIQQSSGALQAAQIGLQVTGNNVANSNTPGYIRQRLDQAAGAATRHGQLLLGSGVRTTGVTQVVDQALLERLQSAKSALAAGETLEEAYLQLEELTNDLDNLGLNHELTEFNNILHELSTSPNDDSLREFVILQADRLTSSLRSVRQQAVERENQWNGRLDDISQEINRLTDRIARLNLEITTLEGGGTSASDASGLRDQRYNDLQQLSTLININVQEQQSGAVSVFAGGDFLVTDGIKRDVYTAQRPDLSGDEVRIVDTDSPLDVTGGELAATLTARDEVFSGFIDDLDEVAVQLIQAFNAVHSQGQGRTGFESIVSTSGASNSGVPVANAGLPFPPRNGTFDINLVDRQGELISTHRIEVRNLGQLGDSTISSIAADIDAIDGLNASINSAGQLEIDSSSSATRFTFGEDTSGFLSSIGLNTFFVGDSASNIDLNPLLKENPSFLSISRGGIGNDTEVLTELVDLVDQPLDQLDGRSVRSIYQGAVSNIAQKIGVQRSATEGLRNLHASLESQHLAVTGVNLDEESIKLIAYQRTFQASSRVIATASEMLEILVNL